VEKAADLALLVTPEASLLEAPDAHHVAVEGDQLVVSQPGIDGHLTGIIASDFRFLGGWRFLGHGEWFEFEAMGRLKGAVL
jgi:hypothetical protein